MIRPDGKKKAYIRLDAGSDSLTLANKIGIIWIKLVQLLIIKITINFKTKFFKFFIKCLKFNIYNFSQITIFFN